MALEPAETDLLLIIDVQNDFCSGGALEVPGGEAVVPVINELTRRFRHAVATQDWHPAGHLSFASSHTGKAPFETTTMPYGEQILWPDHCVQGNNGAAFHPDLALTPVELVIRKGYVREIDSYSAFYENDHTTSTGLAGYLRDRGLKRVFCAGLAFDFCVRYSAEDAAKCGFETIVIEDACRAIDMNGSCDATVAGFQSLGIQLIDSSDI